jgi:hypothetical protein
MPFLAESTGHLNGEDNRFNWSGYSKIISLSLKCKYLRRRK